MLIIAFLIVFVQQTNAQLVQPFRDMYFATGTINREGMVYQDLSFKLSARLRPLDLGNGWKEYFGYTQLTVWDAFKESGPFHDNIYNPGIYFEKKIEDYDITLGLEHMSNGRPYYGDKIADECYDDYSRGLNYVFAEMDIPSGKHSTFTIMARLGTGCGVESHKKHQKPFSQDLLMYYLGYLTFKEEYMGKNIRCRLTVTPIMNKSAVNATLDFSWTFNENFPSLFVQGHYGFDQSMCDCVPGKMPPASIRIGFILNGQ